MTSEDLPDCLTGYSEAALEVHSDLTADHIAFESETEMCPGVQLAFPRPPLLFSLGPRTWDSVSTFWGVSSFLVNTLETPSTDSKPSDLDNEDYHQDMVAEMRTDSRVRPVKLSRETC